MAGVVSSMVWRLASPVGVWYTRACGLIVGKLRTNAARTRNLLERDYHLKQAMGFDESYFTRLGEILRKIET